MKIFASFCAIGFAALSLASPTVAKSLKPGNGIVVLRLIHPDYPKTFVALTTIVGVDGTGKPAPRAFSPKRLYKEAARTNTDEFMIFQVPAGAYLVHNVFLYAGASANYCFAKGTPSLNVTEGKAVYGGTYAYDLRLKPGSGSIFTSNLGDWISQLTRQPDEVAQAEAELHKTYADLALETADAHMTTYPVDPQDDVVFCRDPDS